MQVCGECGKVYDESEYAACPYCYGFHHIDIMRILKSKNASDKDDK